MGRLIDIDVLFDYFGNDAIDETTRSNIEYFVSEKGTVKVIPKADYENRLKADMVAMLTELQLEFEENTVRWYVGRVDGKSDDIVLMETINDIIQQKINALKGENT